MMLQDMPHLCWNDWSVRVEVIVKEQFSPLNEMFLVKNIPVIVKED